MVINTAQKTGIILLNYNSLKYLYDSDIWRWQINNISTRCDTQYNTIATRLFVDRSTKALMR